METIKALAEHMLQYVQELQTAKLEKNKLLAQTDLDDLSKRERLDTLNLIILQYLSTIDNYNEQLALAAYNYTEEPTLMEQPLPIPPEETTLPTPGQITVISPTPLPPSGRTVSLDKEHYGLIKIHTAERSNACRLK